MAIVIVENIAGNIFQNACSKGLGMAIQAFIFTNLTAVFIGQAFEGEHAHGHGEHDDAIIV